MEIKNSKNLPLGGVSPVEAPRRAVLCRPWSRPSTIDRAVSSRPAPAAISCAAAPSGAANSGSLGARALTSVPRAPSSS